MLESTSAPPRWRSPWGAGAGRVVTAHRGGLLAVLAAVLALLASTGPGGTSPAAAEPGAAVVVDGPVRVVGGEEVLIGVAGVRYHDTIELAADGQVINELDTERYVAGVAEMPSRWPLEALKAQAVAARTYAWWSAERGAHAGFDLCATTACQVFRGAEVVLDGGQRWEEAVAATAGEVLVDPEGGPILSRYFSTSGGRTYANEEVFPATGPRSYLVAIDDPYDAVSPYHRWRVRFTREEFDEVLSRGERLAVTVPVVAVERTGDVDDVTARFRVTGGDGSVVEVGAVELRDFLSLVAPDRFPDRFPTRRADGLRPLPSTVPSSRFTVDVGDDEVVLEGRGWGHGVGMGQYGARGRAEDGAAHHEILAAYYGGLQPTRAEKLPDRIRVGLGQRDELTLAADDLVTILDARGEVVVERALGPWTASRVDGGWQLSPPAGHDRELEVGATRSVPSLTRDGEAVTVEAEVNKHVVLRLEVLGEAGQPVATRDLGVAEPGVHAATWRLTDDDGDPVPAGTYRLVLVGEDGAGRSAGTPTEVVVEQPARPADGSGPNLPDALPSGTLLLPAAALGLIALVSLLVLLPSRSRP
ncbi:MAG: SpoIID/LytB domain-containing protein [Nitriliruptor sp.]|nr:MAG: SpoIID/LytB domain-containing protein [Nitriliruptor sp.]